jgi:hypothetical protein
MDNPQELIADLLHKKIHLEAAAVERVHFVKTDRRHDPKKSTPFRYLPGRVPVLVSAPHAVRHYREKKIKPSDEFTGSIACLLHQLTGCHALSVTKLYGGDPNFDYPCIYKSYLGDICRKYGIRLVIDLHGAARGHDFDIDIGTVNGASLLGKQKILQRLILSLENAGLTRISQNYFSTTNENIVTGFVARELNTPAMQLEINKMYRVPHQNGQAYCQLMAALFAFIDGLF